RRHRPGSQQGARDTQDGNDCISDGAAQDREGPGGKADARFVGLPREPGGRREQGTALLQRQESERAAQGRGAAGTGKQDLSCHRRQGCRSQQGDGRRRMGDDRVAAEGEKLEPPRCLRPCEHGDGLPARSTPWTAEGGPLSPAEEYVGGVPIRAGLFGLMLAAAVAAAPAAAVLRVVATTTDMAALAAAVGGGVATVEAIVPAAVDPEAFEPRPGDLDKVRHAALLVRVGLGYDY